MHQNTVKPGPSSQKNYYESSFDSDGALVISYVSCWCNIGMLGSDLQMLCLSIDKRKQREEEEEMRTRGSFVSPPQ